ncbi:hypothetical protein [Enterococcus canis]|uniref:hypothetical protein n=1 Tax=Enterococcus canis TaxID=214095 RepID=UPI0008363BED|nr:hypothetical protein [Enterococcus canis]
MVDDWLLYLFAAGVLLALIIKNVAEANFGTVVFLCVLLLGVSATLWFTLQNKRKVRTASQK